MFEATKSSVPPPLRFGGIEAGGSKFVCGVGGADGRLEIRHTIPTTTPRETVERVAAFFRSDAASGPLAAFGLAAFGPLDLNPQSPTYGYVTSTPKPHWQHCDLAGLLAESLGVSAISIDTDVNCSALAEYQWGAGRDCDPLVYVTLGTGIGGGAIVNGRVLHGLVHPEMGHLRIRRDALDDFPGCCPAHGDCLEGLASGVAMAERWGSPADHLPADHPGWRLETHYVALGLAEIILTLSPKKIVLGGGLRRKLLWRELFADVREILNGYLKVPELGEAIDRYIVPPELNDDAGVLGAIALATRQAGTEQSTVLSRSITV